jgi:leucyl aminopeptidase (aminopeptidase T)
VLVFDGALWPPNELGLLRSPVRLTVADGVVTDIAGDTDAAVFRNWMAAHHDPNMYRLAHWSLGFNPGVLQPTGRIVEDERVFGCVEIGIGTKGAWIGGEPWVAAAHTDGSIRDPSIYLDGEAVEIDGRYVHPELVRICRELGVAGY